jgi:uncharacterized protein (DUF1501 family)
MNNRLTRRQIVTGAALAAAAGAAGGWGRNLSALASVTVGPRGKTGGDSLVVLFLRGGADGLNIVVPYGDDEYYKLRPSLALPGPNDRRADAKSRVVKLDDFFGLHPALASLGPLHEAGQLAAIHAIGSGDQSRSHFEAMEAMERGLAQVSSGTSSGWLARHLASTGTDGESPLRAVAFADTMPDSLRGATNATAMTSLADFRLAAAAPPPTGPGGKIFHRNKPAHKDTSANENTQERLSAFEVTLREMYGANVPYASPEYAGLQVGGKSSLEAMDAIRRLDPANYHPEPGANYPQGEVGNGFRQAACLIKGEVGLEVACLDMGGWDTHVAQGGAIGWQALRLTELGQALAAFAKDLGPHMGRVTTVVMTEFGRRAQENSGLGTDHGRAGAWLLMGGNVVGGKAHADWPGLKRENLDDNGDLRVTTDYRDILAEILSRRLQNDKLAEVFLNYTPRFRNVVRAS